MIPEERHFSQHYVYLIPLIWGCLGVTGSRMWPWGFSKDFCVMHYSWAQSDWWQREAFWLVVKASSSAVQSAWHSSAGEASWLGHLGICECFISLSQNLGTHVRSNTYRGRCEVNEEIHVPNVQHISSGQKRGPECLWLNEPIKQSIWSVPCLCISVLLHMVKICKAGLRREVHRQLYVIPCTWKSVLFPPYFFLSFYLICHM